MRFQNIPGMLGIIISDVGQGFKDEHIDALMQIIHTNPYLDGVVKFSPL